MPKLAAALLDALDDIALRELAARLRPYLHDEPARLLDAREAAALLGLHPETLGRMARAGRIWAVKSGREWRFRADRLEVAPIVGVSPPPSAGTRPRRGRSACPDSVAAIRGSP